MPAIDVLLHGWSWRTDQGSPGFCSIILINGQQRILVDVGHVGRRTFLLDALAQRGLTPSDIDITVMTHAHWDHNQNFDLFPDAPMLVHKLERKYAHKPHHNDWATPQWTGAMIDHHRNIHEVDEGYEIEPGLTLWHAPGHSPGSMTVMVETEQGICAIAGDVIHFGAVAVTRQNPIIFWSETDARKSIDRVLEGADIIYPGHDRPFRLVNGNVEYMVPLDITVYGLRPGMSGVKFDTSTRPSFVMPGIEEQSLVKLL